MVTRPPSLFCDRASIMPRCSMIPVNICDIEDSILLQKCESLTPDSQKWLSHSDSCTVKAVARLPHSKACLDFAVHVLQISLDRHIRPELLHAQVWQRRLSGSGHVREWHPDLAGEFRGVEERKFMDQASRKSGAVQRGACFEQHAQNFSLAELGEHGVEIDTASR